MLKKVFIVEITSGFVVAEIPISYGMANTNTTKNDVFNEAWKSAVEDNLVDAKNKSKYKFELSKN